MSFSREGPFGKRSLPRAQCHLVKLLIAMQDHTYVGNGLDRSVLKDDSDVKSSINFAFGTVKTVPYKSLYKHR